MAGGGGGGVGDRVWAGERWRDEVVVVKGVDGGIVSK